jgi:glutamate racemase
MKNLKIATFDSGFGGFFTAKEIEKVAREVEKKYDANISVQHYGDTKNAPYGEKTPMQIAELTTSGVKFAFDKKADMVFIACNTASTQYPSVRRNIETIDSKLGENVISIIDKTAEHVKNIASKSLANNNEIHIGILSTPATLKSGVYIEKLSDLLDGKLSKGEIESFKQERWNKEAGYEIESNKQKSVIELLHGKKVHIYHVGPGNWVDLIERNGSNKDKEDAVKRDVGILMSMTPENSKLVAVGEFCTHYPVFDEYIKATTQAYGKSTSETEFVKQGAIMAKEFEERLKHLDLKLRPRPLEASGVFANIFITGDNIDATKKLASDLFPSKRQTQVQKIEFEKSRNHEIEK